MFNFLSLIFVVLENNKHWVGQNVRLGFYKRTFWSTQYLGANEYNTSNLQLNGPGKNCVWRKGVG